MEQKNIITFIDHIGRTIFGELSPQPNDDVNGLITVKNPAILHTQPTQDGRLNVQTIPLYFREFISEKNKVEGTLWQFHKQSIIVGINVENDQRLLTQYEALFAHTPTAVAPTTEPKVVKLFDS